MAVVEVASLRVAALLPGSARPGGTRASESQGGQGERNHHLLTRTDQTRAQQVNQNPKPAELNDYMEEKKKWRKIYMFMRRIPD